MPDYYYHDSHDSSNICAICHGYYNKDECSMLHASIHDGIFNRVVSYEFIEFLTSHKIQQNFDSRSQFDVSFKDYKFSHIKVETLEELICEIWENKDRDNMSKYAHLIPQLKELLQICLDYNVDIITA